MPCISVQPKSCTEIDTTLQADVLLSVSGGNIYERYTPDLGSL